MVASDGYTNRCSRDLRPTGDPRRDRDVEQFGKSASVQAIPEELAYLLRTNVLAHVSLTEADGSLLTHVMWVDYDGEHILTSSPTESYKSRALRQRPNIAVSVGDPADPWRRLSTSGRVTEIRDDEGLAFINRLSERYVGAPYPRPGPREIFVITPDRVRAFMGRG
jgi:PPOX class probable F420-dependent enzyme